ncbi:MAG: von Willebrand factor type A domain-containing protein [Blastocatellia bacterium]|nr:von Willebrand factor type A domain-containing protein [Blastocatellia bacterium]
MKRQTAWLGILAFLLGTTLFTNSLAHMQAATGVISGQILDTTGAVIAGATVTVKNEATGVQRSATTDQNGNYTFPNLPPGSYQIAVDAPGFQKLVMEGVKVEPGQIFQQTSKLYPGSATDVVEVLGEAVSNRTIVIGQRASSGVLIAGKPRKRKTKSAQLARVQAANPPMNTESYDRIEENPFLAAKVNPLSTFSIDVDTASYSNLRRFISNNTLPPADAVRIEEMMNYFTYDYPEPKPHEAFSASVEVAECPWKTEHRLVRVGLRGKEIQISKRPPSNLVFLLDVSGSMDEENKLPLVKESLRLLVEQLDARDRVSIVVYAGASGLVLPPTTGDRQEVILKAIEDLSPGGSTNGAEGIELAYQQAQEHFVKGGINRVILATDGDFNVGITDQGALTRLIEKKAKTGVFLTVLGFGMGNYKDSTMEKLADKGNGNYAYIDRLKEARKVLVEQMSGTLQTIAKDVKIQIEFNPAQVTAYRLIGYENRMLAAEDFNDDAKDAGDIGAGHRVTALYEVVPAGVKIELPKVDKLKYQKESSPKHAKVSPELLTLKLRYKQPSERKSQLLEIPVTDNGKTFASASADFKFAAAVAEFGMLLRESKQAGSANLDTVLKLAEAGRGYDPQGLRGEFLEMARQAQKLWQEKQARVEEKQPQ